jgi:hypothetical protein
MNLKINWLILVAGIPVISFADHACVEGRENGEKIELINGFPAKWLTVGGEAITDSVFHAGLRSKFKGNYSINEEEGSRIGQFCAFSDGVYVDISTQESGQTAEYSAVAPICWKCKEAKRGIRYLVSGTGLQIGQTKSEASKLLGYGITNDVTELVFETIENRARIKVEHSQIVRLEFKSEKLIRFSISDYREQYE